MRRRNLFKPICCYDAMGVARLLRLMAEAEGEVIRVVLWDTTRDYVHSCEVAVGQVGELGSNCRYIHSSADPVREARDLKDRALRYGATPEAIRLLGLIVPVSKKEEIDMAEKLKAKGATTEKAKAPKKGDAEALKTAANETPVAKPKAAAEPKKRTMPDGLKKAIDEKAKEREARDKQKIKVLNKDHGARDGSKRANMLNIVLRAKTVGAALEAGATWLDVKFAEQKGLIELA